MERTIKNVTERIEELCLGSTVAENATDCGSPMLRENHPKLDGKGVTKMLSKNT
jgi:hypothetical protein